MLKTAIIKTLSNATSRTSKASLKRNYMYTQLAEIPVPTAAHFANATSISDQNGSSVVQVVYAIRDHARKIKRTMTKSIVISSEGSVVAATPLQDHDIIAQVVSPSRKLRAVLRNAKSGGSPATRLVEIWNRDLLEISANVTECHGDFYADEYLASLSFAPSESAILYTAEGNVPETKNPFEKFRFNPDFGEGLVGKKRPVTFILRWDSNQSTTNNPGKLKPTLMELKTEEDVRFGQASFSPNSDKIVYATGYEFTMDGRILGLKGCYNRPNGIWKLRLPELLPESGDKLNPATAIAVISEKLTPASLSCRSPRALTHVGGSTLAWLACQTGGAHVGASALYSLDISSDSDTSRALKFTERPLVPIIRDEIPSSPNLFPGLYPSYNLPSSPSAVELTSGPYIVTHSQWGSRTTVLLISTQDGVVTNLTPSSKEEGLYSWTVLATDGRSRILCQRSSTSVPYEILLGRFDDAGHISWNLIDKPDLPGHIETALSTIRTSIVPIPDRYPVETILIQPNNGNNATTTPPLITYPHGGPHGTTSTAFSATTTALVLEGYTVSLPNYTGSVGYGDGFVQRLIGNCGKLDVEDCYASTRHLIQIGIAEEGPGQQFVIGGSHGGFLGAHLIGQFPDMFSAAVLRNPVISAGAISTSDIPDWYFSEFGIDYPLVSSSPTVEIDHSKADSSSRSLPPPLVSSEIYTSLFAASPISLVDSIQIPVLLLIGAADRRVAPSQGIEFYHALKARYASSSAAGPRVHDRDYHRKVDMLMFEGESHPLDGVEAAQVNFEVTRDWLADA